MAVAGKYLGLYVVSVLAVAFGLYPFLVEPSLGPVVIVGTLVGLWSIPALLLLARDAWVDDTKEKGWLYATLRTVLPALTILCARRLAVGHWF